MYLRIAKCKKGGTWLKQGWLAKRKAGLFVLFGYVAKGIGHFVGYNAERDRIMDGATGYVHNLCEAAIEQIFPFGLDCIHQLLLIEKDLIGRYRLQIRFQRPDFRTIAKGKYEMLLAGAIDDDWMI
jgi:hypothetical protein